MATSGRYAKPMSSEASSSSKTKKHAVEISHIWIIDNLSFHTRDRVVASPPFSAGVDDGVRWCLQLFPTGQGNDAESKNWVSFYLNLHTCDSGALVKYRISILNDHHEVLQKMFINEPIRLVQGSGWGMGKLIRREVLFSNNRLPRDRLIVFCELTYALDVVIVLSQNSPVRTDAASQARSGDSDEAEQFGSQMFSDVVLVADDKEFRAHKAILADQSPVLKTMFERDQQGRQGTRRVEMSGMDGETLREILCLIYTGQSKALRKMSDKLRAAIEKYNLWKLIAVAECPEEESVERISIDDETMARPTVVQDATSGSASAQGGKPGNSNTTEPSDPTRPRRSPVGPPLAGRAPKQRKST